ncbi:MAG: class I SAM-dependent methyltransferase [Pseudomonadota bacterium]
MYSLLEHFTARPECFELCDTGELWTNPHVAEKMLQFHLDGSNDLASRSEGAILHMVTWLCEHVEMGGKTLLDLGCGPGLYAAHFQRAGAKVIGIDISHRSIAHARDSGIPDAEFLVGSYHDLKLPQSDIVALIYGDICAMPQSKRSELLIRVNSAMPSGGHLIVDCYATSLFTHRREETLFEVNLDGGFWAPAPYFGFKQTFVYPTETTALDKYLIVEREGNRLVYNWLQYLSPAQLSSELTEAGFSVGPPLDVSNGQPWQSAQGMFCLLAQKV